jgi:hypothetical protein
MKILKIDKRLDLIQIELTREDIRLFIIPLKDLSESDWKAKSIILEEFERIYQKALK